MNKERLEELKKSSFSQIIIDWFSEEIDKMCDISSHKSWEEVLGKQYASRLLKEFIRFLEAKEPEKRIGNQYK